MKKLSWRYSLQSKLFWVFTVLLLAMAVSVFTVCVSLFWRYFDRQSHAYIADVNELAAVNENYLIEQISQLSVSVLVDSTVQGNLMKINAYRGAEAQKKEITALGEKISSSVKGEVFSLDSVVSLRIYSLWEDEIFVGTTNRDALALPLTSQEIYRANGAALWAMSDNSHYLCVSRAILSTSTMRPIGYMVLVCKNSAFSDALQTLSSSYTSRVYVLDQEQRIVASNVEGAVGAAFPHTQAELYGSGQSTLADPLNGETCYYDVAGEMKNGWTMVTMVSIQQIQNGVLGRVRALAVLVVCAFTLALLLLVVSTNQLMQPTKELLSSFYKFGQGALDTRVHPRTKDEIGRIGTAYNQMADSIQNLLEKVYKLELANKEAEIEFLKMQINPHFLYNTLDTISWLGIIGGNEDVSDISVSLARLLRANIKSDSMITVEEEMNTIRDYLQIQHHRFGEKVNVSYQVAKEAEHCYMPNFLLQPLVENSIMHGLEELDAVGFLSITIVQEDNWLTFAVSDTGRGMSEEKVAQLLEQCEDITSHNAIGLKNVYRRLQLLYGKACRFHIESGLEEGTCISFRIPIMYEPPNEEETE